MAITYTEYHPEMSHFPQFSGSFPSYVLGKVLFSTYVVSEYIFLGKSLESVHEMESVSHPEPVFWALFFARFGALFSVDDDWKTHLKG